MAEEPNRDASRKECVFHKVVEEELLSSHTHKKAHQKWLKGREGNVHRGKAPCIDAAHIATFSHSSEHINVDPNPLHERCSLVP